MCICVSLTHINSFSTGQPPHTNQLIDFYKWKRGDTSFCGGVKVRLTLIHADPDMLIFQPS